MLEIIKKYWWVILIVGIVIYYQLKISNINDILDVASSSYQQQIEVIQKNKEEEYIKRALLIKEHKEKLKQIEDTYIWQIDELLKQKPKKIKEVVKTFDKEPQLIADKIVKMWGFKQIK